MGEDRDREGRERVEEGNYGLNIQFLLFPTSLISNCEHTPKRTLVVYTSLWVRVSPRRAGGCWILLQRTVAPVFLLCQQRLVDP